VTSRLSAHSLGQARKFSLEQILHPSLAFLNLLDVVTELIDHPDKELMAILVHVAFEQCV
jgi:hypothetical protein